MRSRSIFLISCRSYDHSTLASSLLLTASHASQSTLIGKRRNKKDVAANNQKASVNCSPTYETRFCRPSHGERSCCCAKVRRGEIRLSVLNRWRTSSGQLHS